MKLSRDLLIPAVPSFLEGNFGNWGWGCQKLEAQTPATSLKAIGRLILSISLQEISHLSQSLQ